MMRKRSVTSVVITVLIILMLLLSQPAMSLLLSVQTDKTQYTLGETVTFKNTIRIESNELIPIVGVRLEVYKDGSSFDVVDLPIKQGTYVKNGEVNNLQQLNVTVMYNNVAYKNGALQATYSSNSYIWGYGYGYGYSYTVGPAYVNYTVKWGIPSDALYTGDYSVRLVLLAGDPNNPDELISSEYNFHVSALGQINITVDTPAPDSYTNKSTIWVNGTVDDPTLDKITRVLQTAETTLLNDDVENVTKSLDTWTNTTEDMAQPGWYYSGPSLWHLTAVESNNDIDGGTHSWWYGKLDNGMKSYNTPGQPNAGILRTKNPINIGAGTKLTFWTWWDTEMGPDFDHKLVVVFNNSNIEIVGMVVDPPPGGPGPGADIQYFKDVLHLTYDGVPNYVVRDDLQVAFVPQGTWQKVEIDLSAYAGKSVEIGFLFNTKDEWANDFQGWFIDDIKIVGAGAIEQPIPVTNKKFNTTVELAEGLNQITLKAVNAYGAQGKAIVNVTLDTTPPQVGFIGVPQYTNQSVLNVSWYVTDPNLDKAEVYLKVAGGVTKLIQKKDKSGNYYTLKTLQEGANVLEIKAYDKAGNVNTTTMTVVLDTTPPSLQVLPVVYPVGVVSARPGDEAVIRVIANDTGVGLEGVYLLAPGGGGPNETQPELIRMNETEEFYKLIWEIGNATHFTPITIPTDVPIVTGNYTFNITAIDKAGNKNTASVNVYITSTLSAFTINLMPGWNLISLPLIPDNGSVAALTKDVKGIEAIWYYDSSTGNWSVYSPGPAPDDLNELTTGKGYWVRMNSSAFETVKIPGAPLPAVAVPIKLKYTGVYLKPGQLPPTYSVYKGWNLIGFHSEVNMTVKEYLSGLTYPQRTWTSLIGYNNYVDFRHNKVAEGVFERLKPDDYMKPGNGYWLYVKESGEITP